MSFDSSFNLGSLNGRNGFKISGDTISGDVGSVISSAGDINGDGIVDIVIGNPEGQGPQNSIFFSSGESYVIFGGSDVARNGRFDVSSLNGRNGFVVYGTEALQYSGAAVSAAGDINNDGLDDLIVGTPGEEQVQIIFGSRRSNFFNGRLDIDQLNGNNGVTFESGAELNESFGSAVSGLGDVNADGIDDFIVGAPRASIPGGGFAGRGYVLFGKSNIANNGQFDVVDLNGRNGFVMEGVPQLLSALGSAVSDAGDANGDGVNDLLISAPKVGDFGAGEAYVLFGGRNIGKNGLVQLTNLNGRNGFRIPGVKGSELGRSLSSAGDVNNDGIDDIIVGVPRPTNGGPSPTGESYVIFGSRDIGQSGRLDPTRLNGSNGFKIKGERDFSQFGTSVSGAGDVNNDGIDDLLVGTEFSAFGYVVYGDETVGKSGLLNIADIDGTNGFRFSEQFQRAGREVSNLGDFNNDGIDDFLAADSLGKGRTYVVYGQGEPIDTNTDPEAVNDRFVGQSNRLIQGNVLRNDSDADGDSLSAALVNDVRKGQLTFRKNGTFSYRPKAGFSGQDRFTYEVSDGNGGTDRASVLLTTQRPNRAPVAKNDFVRLKEDRALTISVLKNDRDPDGDKLTLRQVSRPRNGRVIRRNNGTVLYRPNPGFSGRDQFTYQIADGRGGSDTGTVNVRVIPKPNRAPRAQNDRVRVLQNQATSISVLKNDRDPDGDELTLRSVSRPRNGRAIRRNNGTVLYRPDRGFSGTDRFTYQVSDGQANRNATVFVTVAKNNRQAQSQALTVVEDDLLFGGVSTNIQTDISSVELSQMTSLGSSLGASLQQNDAFFEVSAIASQPTDGILQAATPNFTL